MWGLCAEQAEVGWLCCPLLGVRHTSLQLRWLLLLSHGSISLGGHHAVHAQMATALYFIDKLALRAGHEKDEDEADTVGCCTLKVRCLCALCMALPFHYWKRRSPWAAAPSK